MELPVTKLNGINIKTKLRTLGTYLGTCRGGRSSEEGDREGGAPAACGLGAMALRERRERRSSSGEVRGGEELICVFYMTERGRGGVAKAVVECFGGGGINSGGVEWRRFQEGR
jgi:hypothetical protein